MKMRPAPLFALPLICLALNACGTTEEPPEGSNRAGAVLAPEPPSRMDQQIANQEAINHINRSLAPF